MALERIDPQGQWRADLRAAQICCSVVNMLRDPKKSQAARVVDFLPDFDQGEQEMTPEETVAYLRQMATGD